MKQKIRSIAAKDSTWYRLKRYALDNGLTLEKALDKLLDFKTEKN